MHPPFFSFAYPAPQPSPWAGLAMSSAPYIWTLIGLHWPALYVGGRMQQAIHFPYRWARA